MADKDDKKKDEEKKASDKELTINSTLAGAVGYQNWEQARDKTVDDYYFGQRNKVTLKLSIYMRRLKEKMLKEKANGGKVTVEMELEVAEELNKNKLLSNISNTIKNFKTLTSNYEDRSEAKIKVIFSAKDVMSETYYHDLDELEKMDALLTALIDNDDIPVVSEKTVDDLIENIIRERIENGLEVDDG
jgi:hypothetical protein